MSTPWKHGFPPVHIVQVSRMCPWNKVYMKTWGGRILKYPRDWLDHRGAGSFHHDPLLLNHIEGFGGCTWTMTEAISGGSIWEDRDCNNHCGPREVSFYFTLERHTVSLYNLDGSCEATSPIYLFVYLNYMEELGNPETSHNYFFIFT